MSENGNMILPEWFDGKKINEALFCAEFIRDFPMITINDSFFTVNGRVTDENSLKKEIRILRKRCAAKRKGSFSGRWKDFTG